MVAVFTGFVGSYGSLLACRLLLGLFESALFPSLNLYTSMFWKREEIAKRASMLLVGQATAGAFGGLLAWAIVQIPNTGGYASWRWLFFVEGMLTFTVGVGGFFLLPNSAGTAFFLTQEEKELAQLRLVHNGVEDKFNKAQVKEALQSPMCWLSGFIQFSSDTYNYGGFWIGIRTATFRVLISFRYSNVPPNDYSL